MKSGKLDPRLREDLSEYLVVVSTKRPHFYKEMQSGLLDCEHRFNEGDALALHDAVLFCERGGLPMPPWMSGALRQYLVEGLSGGITGSKGRGNSPFGNAKKRLKQQVHFRLVRKCASIALSLKTEKVIKNIVTQGRSNELGNMRHVFPPAIWEQILDQENSLNLDDFSSTLDSHYIAVSKILRGTFAQAEPRTIMNSCKKEREIMKDSIVELPDGNRASNYIDWIERTDPETLEAFGLQIELSEAELSAFHMGSELVDIEADRSDVHEHFFNPSINFEDSAEKS